MTEKYNYNGEIQDKELILINPGTDAEKMLYDSEHFGNEVGLLSDYKNLNIAYNFNSQWTMEFEYSDSSNDVQKRRFNAIQVLKYVFVRDVGYFIITNVKNTYSDGKLSKTVSCSSVDKELENFEMPYISDGSYRLYKHPDDSSSHTDTTLLDLIVSVCPRWKIGSVDLSLLGTTSGSVVSPVYRYFDNFSVGSIYTFLFEKIENAFECVIIPNYITRTLNFYSRKNWKDGHRTPIRLSYDNLINSMSSEENISDLYTAVDASGKNDLSIRPVNPSGKNIIYNFSGVYTRMSSVLREILQYYSDQTTSYMNSKKIKIEHSYIYDKESDLCETNSNGILVFKSKWYIKSTDLYTSDTSNSFKQIQFIDKSKYDSFESSSKASDASGNNYYEITYAEYTANKENRIGLAYYPELYQKNSDTDFSIVPMFYSYPDLNKLFYELSNKKQSLFDDFKNAKSVYDSAFTAYESALSSLADAKKEGKDTSTEKSAVKSTESDLSAKKSTMSKCLLRYLVYKMSLTSNTSSASDSSSASSGSSTSLGGIAKIMGSIIKMMKSMINYLSYGVSENVIMPMVELMPDYFIDISSKISEVNTNMDIYNFCSNRSKVLYLKYVNNTDPVDTDDKAWTSSMLPSWASIYVLGILEKLAYVSAESSDKCTEYSKYILNELSSFIRVLTYSDECSSLTDSMTLSEQFEQSQILYDRALSKLDDVTGGERKISIDASSFVFNDKFMPYTAFLEPGCSIMAEMQPNIFEQAYLTNLDINYSDKSMSLTFANKTSRYDPKSIYDSLFGDLSKTTEAARQFTSTVSSDGKIPISSIDIPSSYGISIEDGGTSISSGTIAGMKVGLSKIVGTTKDGSSGTFQIGNPNANSGILVGDDLDDNSAIRLDTSSGDGDVITIFDLKYDGTGSIAGFSILGKRELSCTSPDGLGQANFRAYDFDDPNHAAIIVTTKASASDGWTTKFRVRYDGTTYIKDGLFYGTVHDVDSSSDRNVKSSIEDFDSRYDKFFDSLKPKRYKYIGRESEGYHTGYIAQDVEDSLRENSMELSDLACLKKYDSEFQNGSHYELKKDELVALNTWEIQKLKSEIAELKSEISAMKSTLNK